MAFEDLPGGDSSTSLGNLLQYSTTHKAQKHFLTYTQNLFCCSLCPVPLLQALGTNEKSLESVFSALSSGI